jgi:hypothetical protein
VKINHGRLCSKMESKIKNWIRKYKTVFSNFIKNNMSLRNSCKSSAEPGVPWTTLCIPHLQSKFRLRSRRLIGPSNPVTTLQDSKTNIPHSLPPFLFSYFSAVSTVEWCSRVPLTHNWEVRLRLLISIESNGCSAHSGLPERSRSHDILEADHTNFPILIWVLIYVDYAERCNSFVLPDYQMLNIRMSLSRHNTC